MGSGVVGNRGNLKHKKYACCDASLLIKQARLYRDKISVEEGLPTQVANVSSIDYLVALG